MSDPMTSTELGLRKEIKDLISILEKERAYSRELGSLIHQIDPDARKRLSILRKQIKDQEGEG